MSDDDQWWANDPVATGKGGKPITFGNSGKAPTEDQGKVGSFYLRAIGANSDFEKTGTDAAGNPTGIEPRGVLQSAAHAVLPTSIENTFLTPERQRADASQREFIAATLRRDSGAAISQDEFDNQYKLYFPVSGDDPSTIAQKADARRRAVEGLRLGTTPELATGAQKFATEQGGALPGTTVATPQPDPEATGDIGFGKQPPKDPIKQLSPEDRAAFLQLAQTGSPAQMVQFMKDRGFDLENADAVATARDKGAGVNPNIVTKLPKTVDAGDGATGSFMRGVGDTATSGFLDEAGAVVDTLGGTDKRENIWNSRRPIKDILYGNIDQNRAIMAGDEESHGTARTLGQLTGAVAMPIGSGARTPMELAKVGGGLGAMYGLGSGEGGVVDRLPGAIVGGASGAALGYGGGRLAEMIGARGAPPPTSGGPGAGVMDAADRLNVPVVTADVQPGARGATALLESVPFSSNVVRGRLQAGSDAMEARVGELGNGAAAPERVATGEAVQQGAQHWIDRSRGTGSRLYTRAEQLASGQQVAPTNAIQAIDSHIDELSQTPGVNNAKLNLLNRLRGDLVDDAGNPRPLGIGAIRDLRTGMREEINASNIRSSDMDRRLGDVMDAANADIRAGLQSNPRALGAYDRADQFWRQRAEHVDNVLSQVIGKADNPIGGEQVMAKIESLAARRTGNSAKLDSLLNSLRPDERDQVASNIAAALGRATPDAEFSPQRLFTQIGKLSPRSRVSIFGQDGAAALDDLATVAEARANTIRNLNNSGSGRVSNYLQTIRGLMGLGGGAGLGVAAGAGAAGGAAMTAAGLAGANISARVLTNPAMARWFARGLGQSSVAGARTQINRLSQIATSNPGIRAEVLGIQERLMKAVNDNVGVGRAAASGEQGDGQQK